MLFIKPRTPPFATEEEAIKFFHKNGEYEFKKTIERYSHSLYNLQMKLIIFLFPLYLLLASTVFLFDYKEVNYFFYSILRSISIPVQHPYGWNFSYILSFLFHVVIFICVIKPYDFSIIRKIVKLKKKKRFKYFFCLIGYILFIIFFIISSHFVTMPKRSTSCTLATYCALQSDSMFLYSSLILYMCFSGVEMMLTAFLYVKFTLPYMDFKFIK